MVKILCVWGGGVEIYYHNDASYFSPLGDHSSYAVQGWPKEGILQSSAMFVPLLLIVYRM